MGKFFLAGSKCISTKKQKLYQRAKGLLLSIPLEVENIRKEKDWILALLIWNDWLLSVEELCFK